MQKKLSFIENSRMSGRSLTHQFRVIGAGAGDVPARASRRGRGAQLPDLVAVERENERARAVAEVMLHALRARARRLFSC